MRKKDRTRPTKPHIPDAATLTARESTRITGFGITHTYTLLRRGEMPAIKIGKKFFIPKSALLRWLDNCGTDTRPAA